MEAQPAVRKLALTAKVVSYALYFWLLTSIAIMLLGFILLLFGANPEAGFTEWAYRNLERVMQPFRGIFEPIPLGENAQDVLATVDTSILFGMVVYGIVVLALHALIQWLNMRIAMMDELPAPRAAAHPPVLPPDTFA